MGVLKKIGRALKGGSKLVLSAAERQKLQDQREVDEAVDFMREKNGMRPKYSVLGKK